MVRIILMALVLLFPLQSALAQSSKKTQQAKVLEVTAKGYDKAIKNGLVLVDFWATWCGPCRKMMPVIEDLSLTANLSILKYDVDAGADFAKRKGISSIPTFILYKDGKEVERLVGVYTKAELLSIIGKHR